MTSIEAIYELSEICNTRCGGAEEKDECGECEIATACEALEKQKPFVPTTENLNAGIGRCKCGVEFLDRNANYCGNCGQHLRWQVCSHCKYGRIEDDAITCTRSGRKIEGDLVRYYGCTAWMGRSPSGFFEFEEEE